MRQRTEAAEALQGSLLPRVLKPIPGVEMAAAHMPPTLGREVGGDFYDIYPTPDGWGIAIGDVVGKGQDAAAVTAAARHAIRVLGALERRSRPRCCAGSTRSCWPRRSAGGSSPPTRPT